MEGTHVETGRDARVSLQHSVAAAFLFGAAGLAQYEEDCVADPAVCALRARVVFEEDPAAPVESATVTLHLADGTERSQHIRHGRGTPDQPMSDAELDTKVRELAAYGAPFIDAAGLIEAVRGIEEEADATRLMRLTVPARSRQISPRARACIATRDAAFGRRITCMRPGGTIHRRLLRRMIVGQRVIRWRS